MGLFVTMVRQAGGSYLKSHVAGFCVVVLGRRDVCGRLEAVSCGSGFKSHYS